ncbi:MAG: SAVED domain-containing protein, partial [Caldilineaceae bacterium]|nr:SAVED domain-containing protein [Caldilineaceae bacterium]
VPHRGHNTFAATQPDSSSPDGVLLQNYGMAETAGDVTLLRFVNTIAAYSQLLDSHCPLFVVLPLHLHPTLTDTLNTLDVDLNRIQLLDSTRSPIELANRLLTATFAYGYARRGGLATVNIAVRSSESRVNSVLLDLDWCAWLGIDRFPTCDEWDNLLKPALVGVRQQLHSQSDRMRVQFHCQLPLPAAFALGFVFNVRVAHVGVWARKTGVSDFKRQFWLSDSDPAPVHYEPIWIQRTDGCSQVAVVELTSYVSIHNAVKALVDATVIAVNTWVQLPLLVDGKSMENIEEGYALAYAKQVAQLIRALNEQGVTDIHLFARIPAALAVLIGQRLVACGRIHLYWFDNPTYRFAFTLI